MRDGFKGFDFNWFWGWWPWALVVLVPGLVLSLTRRRGGLIVGV